MKKKNVQQYLYSRFELLIVYILSLASFIQHTPAEFEFELQISSNYHFPQRVKTTSVSLI